MDTVANKSDQEKFDEFLEKGCVEFTAFRNLKLNYVFKFGVYILDINGISVELMFNMNLHRKQTYKKHDYAYPLVNSKFISIKNKGISVAFSKFSKDEPLYNPNGFQVLVQHVEFVESLSEIIIKLDNEANKHNLRLYIATVFRHLFTVWNERTKYKIVFETGNEQHFCNGYTKLSQLFKNFDRSISNVSDFYKIYATKERQNAIEIRSFISSLKSLQNTKEQNEIIFEEVVNLFQYQFNKLK